MFVARRPLRLRCRHQELFAEGDYQPFESEGERSSQLCAFSRNPTGETVVAAVPRLIHQLYVGGIGSAAWGTTEICLPPGREWQDVFTGRKFDYPDRVRACDLFADFPVCVLIAMNTTSGKRVILGT